MGHILKNEDIQEGERFRLPVDGSAPTGNDATTAVSGDQARIVEQHADYSVIEIVCTCGQTLRIRCDHPA